MKALSIRELLSYFQHEKRRIAIAMMGIAIGVLSLVIMDSISGAMTKKLKMALGKMGNSLIMLLPGEVKTFGQRRIQLSKYTTLKIDDIRAIQEKIISVKKISGYKQKTVSVQTPFNSSNLSITGCEKSYPELLDYKVEAGRYFTKTDLKNNAKVAVIGSKIASDFFNRNPIGQDIYLSGFPFRVIGVLEKRGSLSNEDFDEVVLIPITTHMKIIENVDYLDGAVILAASENALKTAIKQIKLFLLKRHGKTDFSISTYQELQTTTSKTISLFSVLSRIVASIAFSVGTLGILAIMALSIYERMLEIAIKRVTGARKRDIFVQFLLESLIISITGSITGILLSISLAITVQILANWPIYLPWKTVAISVGLSISAGVISGLYPALKALEFEPKAILRIFEEA